MIRNLVQTAASPVASRVRNWFTEEAGSLYLTNKRLMFVEMTRGLPGKALIWNLTDVVEARKDRARFLKAPLIGGGAGIPLWAFFFGGGPLFGAFAYGLAPWSFLFPSRLAVSMASGERQVFILREANKWVDAIRAAIADAKSEEQP